PIHIAAAYGLVGLVEHYLDQGTDPNIPNQQGNSPLHLCCLLDGGKRVMEVLIERSANIDLKNQNGTTPLLMLFGSSPPQMEKIEYLLKNKADPDVADKEGRTCLQFAVQTSNQDLCERILRQGADINAAGEHKEDGRTCLHQAVLLKQGASEMVELLLSHQADVNQPDKLGRTPLHDAPAAPDSVSIIRALLGAGANFDAQDKDSRAPLYTAIQLANIEA
ncbi:ankyrin, partial [Aspergillus indologenus CBS 114.80]